MRVVETGGDGVRRGDLPALVLEDVAECALKHAGAAPAFRHEARRVFAQTAAAPAGLDADHADGGVREEGVEESDGV